MIEIQFHTEDPLALAICQRYWAVNEKSRFTETAKDICSEFEINNYNLIKILKENCTARYFYTKDDWELRLHVDSRRKFRKLIEDHKIQPPEQDIEFRILLAMTRIMNSEEWSNVKHESTENQFEHQYIRLI